MSNPDLKGYIKTQSNEKIIHYTLGMQALKDLTDLGNADGNTSQDHLEGFVKLVPGMVAGSCDLLRAPGRVSLTKSACLRSSIDVLVRFVLAPSGVIRPSVLWGWCNFTSRMASDKSLSLETMTEQS